MIFLEGGPKFEVTPLRHGQTDRETTYCGITALCDASQESVYIYRSYRKIKSGVPLFWTTEYVLFSNCKLTTRAVHRVYQRPFRC